MKFKPKKLPFEEFKAIYAKVPRLCIDLIIKTKDGIVLSKRSIPPAKGKWHFPGGTVLFGEKITDTINRVSQEETGLKLKVQKIIGTIEYKSDSVFGHTISISYLVKPISGKLRGSKQGKEITYFKSIPKNTLKEQKGFLLKNNLLS